MALLAACLCASRAPAGVDVALTPTLQTVPPGAEFDVTVQVPQGGSPFNGFHLIVGYDPAALTPVPLSPLRLQCGSLMTQACSEWPFHQFQAGGGTVAVDFSLMCHDVDVNGPGDVYYLRFRAASTVQETSLQILEGTYFVDAGIYAPDLTVHGAGIGIGTTPTLDAGDAPGSRGLALEAAPNPSRGPTTLSFGRPLTREATLTVRDIQGRSVRHLRVAAGSRASAWDGRNDQGARVPPGQYLLAMRVAGRELTARVTQIR